MYLIILMFFCCDTHISIRQHATRYKKIWIQEKTPQLNFKHMWITVLTHHKKRKTLLKILWRMHLWHVDDRKQIKKSKYIYSKTQSCKTSFKKLKTCTYKIRKTNTSVAHNCIYFKRWAIARMKRSEAESRTFKTVFCSIYCQA